MQCMKHLNQSARLGLNIECMRLVISLSRIPMAFFRLLFVSVFCLLSVVLCDNFATAIPRMNDSDLEVQTVTAGLLKPTSMAFLGPNDILVLEQQEGRVYRIIDGVLQVEPVVKVNVSATDFGQGLLGIDVQELSNSSYYLFLYFTEAESSDNKTAIGNKLYRYTLVDNATSGPPQSRIVETKLLLDLPVDAGMTHNGGKVRIDSNGGVNVIIGDLHHRRGQAQNIENGTALDGSGGILTVSQEGGKARDGVFGITHPADKYLAYGIRNSFGMDYDPLTGMLWITENGDYSDDEINLADIGFNSGWNHTIGMAPPEFNFSNLVDFGGKGKYSDPEFVWNETVAPTAVEFLRSVKLRF